MQSREPIDLFPKKVNLSSTMNDLPLHKAYHERCEAERKTRQYILMEAIECHQRTILNLQDVLKVTDQKSIHENINMQIKDQERKLHLLIGRSQRFVQKMKNLGLKDGNENSPTKDSRNLFNENCNKDEGDDTIRILENCDYIEKTCRDVNQISEGQNDTNDDLRKSIENIRVFNERNSELATSLKSKFSVVLAENETFRAKVKELESPKPSSGNSKPTMIDSSNSPLGFSSMADNMYDSPLIELTPLELPSLDFMTNLIE